ncbi:MAG: Ig-like domain-containing protein [Paracoccaceae bacterium]
MATYFITTEQDGIIADGQLSLREAVLFANQNPGPDVIDFSELGNSPVTLGLTQGELPISDTLTINGGGNVTLDALGISRALQLTNTQASLTVRDLTIVNGDTTGLGGGVGDGGAIRSLGDLVLTNVTLRDNQTGDDGQSGGAVYGFGDVTITDSVIENNRTLGDNAPGGGVFAEGEVVLTRSTVTDNSTSGASGSGGGIGARGAVAVVTSTVSDNATGGTYANGGGIYAGGNLRVEGSTISGNDATGLSSVGGGIATRGDLSLLGTSLTGNRTTQDGSKGGGAYADGSITVGSLEEFSGTRASIVSGNTTDGANAAGGGLFSNAGVTLSDLALSDNGTDGLNSSGGAVSAGGDVALTNVTFSGNSTSGTASLGGAVFAGGDLDFAGGSASGSATDGVASVGGAIAVDGDATLSDVAFAENTTAQSESAGGALFVGGALTMLDVIFEDNGTEGIDSDGGAVAAIGAIQGDRLSFRGNTTEGDDASGGALSGAADVAIRDSLFDENATTGVAATGGALDVGGALTLLTTTVGNSSTAGANATGGGISVGGSALVTNSTIAANTTAGSLAQGGGLFVDGEAALFNTTVTANATLGTTSAGGGVFVRDALTLGNSIVLGNAAALSEDEDQEIAGGADFSGPETEGENIFGAAGETASQVFASTVSLPGQARGGLLADNGGLRATVALNASGSNPALDVGQSSLLSEAASGRDLTGDGDTDDVIRTDGRGEGFARDIPLPQVGNAQSDTVDLGAFEASQVNQAPTANDDATSLTEDDSFVDIAVLANDFDADQGGGISLLDITADGIEGSVAALPSGAVRYTNADAFQSLAVGESAVETFTYRIQDQAGGTASATVTVTVTGRNDPPTAADDTAAIASNAEALRVEVLANDSDPDASDALRVSALDTGATLGAASISADGTAIDYAPDGAFATLLDGETATDTVVYTLSDGQGGTATATLTVTISGQTVAPIPVDDVAGVGEDGPSVAIDVLANDIALSPDRPISVIALEQTGTLGRAEITGEGAGVSYSPQGAFEALSVGQTATDTFRYTISDGLASAIGEVTVTVAGQNDAPSAADDTGEVSADAGETGFDVLANDTDPDQVDTLLIVGIDPGETLGAARVSDDGTQILYDPGAAFAGLTEGQTATDRVAYVAGDGEGGTALATLTITVTGTAAQLPPIAAPDTLAAPAEAGILFDVLADNGAGTDSDPNGDPLTVSVETDALNGRIAVIDDGRVVYRANDGFVGRDFFEYRIDDGAGNSAVGRGIVDVPAEIVAPEISPAEAQCIALLYEAAFDRLGDIEGINFWIDGLEAGETKRAIAAEFLGSDEFTNTNGEIDDLDDEAYVQLLFNNVFGREGEEDAVEFWLERLADPTVTRSDVLLSFSESFEALRLSPAVATLVEEEPGIWDFAEAPESFDFV